MGNVRRVYVEKKKDYAVKAKELLEELRQYLGLSIDDLRILIRYDIEDLSDESYQKALGTVFSEPPVDEVYEEEFPKAEDEVSCFLWSTCRDSLIREQIPQSSV